MILYHYVKKLCSKILSLILNFQWIEWIKRNKQIIHYCLTEFFDIIVINLFVVLPSEEVNGILHGFKIIREFLSEA